MLVLAIDSSSSTATCALVSEKGVLGEINLNDKKQHSVLLMDLIDDLLKYNNLKIKDLDGFAISEGPGSFTGLRIGMATVKGLSFGSKGFVRWMSTREVVEISLKNINKKLKVIVIPGFCNKFLYFVSKFTPRWLYYKVAIKGWELMD